MSLLTWSGPETEAYHHISIVLFSRGVMLMTITIMLHSLPESVTISFQCFLTAVIQPSVVTFSFCVEELWRGGLPFTVGLLLGWTPYI